jgi:hypothetical protein
MQKTSGEHVQRRRQKLVSFGSSKASSRRFDGLKFECVAFWPCEWWTVGTHAFVGKTTLVHRLLNSFDRRRPPTPSTANTCLNETVQLISCKSLSDRSLVPLAIRGAEMALLISDSRRSMIHLKSGVTCSMTVRSGDAHWMQNGPSRICERNLI